ncbi:MAG TPA: serine/threonine protein kinase [Dokdonella sp.]|uniref:serine/threonine protein kinase n=1 Tax=Dokdonella sp. TaxID=2291710 RepID=UPI002D7EF3D0|nr:serine/threonine protein kinase [Dokdonella sp.]HET9033949.1 serine/threonine protein kinase [Dokdonella sp.]
MHSDDDKTRLISRPSSDAATHVVSVPMDLTLRLGDVATVQMTAAAADDDSETLPIDSSQQGNHQPEPNKVPSPGNTSGNGDPSATEGDRVRYVIVGEAGRGGMATVHIAHDPALLRKVALKQLSDDLRGVDQAHLRFLREVQVTAQLDHPYIVPVYGLEVAPGGAPAYAMKLVTGQTIFDYLQETIAAYDAGNKPDEAHSLSARIEHLVKICEAVDYAHGKGVIHRDLKPANIMLGEHGEIYVMDWGICRLFADSGPEDDIGASLSDSTGGVQTEYGTVVGTPRYMSPEQAQGRVDEIGPHSDQCALGLMLFEIVTLKAPFAGRTPQEVLRNAASAHRVALSHAFERRAIDAPLRAIIERATRKDPRQRYSSVGELADDLRRYLRGEPVHALPDSTWQRAQRFAGHHRQGMLLSLVGLIAAASLGFLALNWHHERLADAARALESQQRDLMEHVAHEGDKLQMQLALVQSQLESLALAAAQLAQFGTPDRNAQIYWDEDFLDPSTRPPDFALNPQTGREVSTQSATWSVAPGIDRIALVPLAQRLSHLRGYRNQLLELTRNSLGGGQYASGLIELKLALQQGLFMHYPGHVLVQADDLRQSVWYGDVKAQSGSRWGLPHVDAEGDDVLLSLTSPLRDPDGGFLGALSMDVAVDFIVHNLLRTDDGHVLILLDADARVLASEDLLTEPVVGTGAVLLEPFGDATLRKAFKEDEVGAVATTLSGRSVSVAFDHIQPLGWILVLVSEDSQAQ